MNGVVFGGERELREEGFCAFREREETEGENLR